ncbi:MAG: hypothetical protein MRJ65_06975 [Candidatus Brocadiaceae bacterium]|nr:hypothetical protein [Candidatus Brocadiaceae bacterium]
MLTEGAVFGKHLPEGGIIVPITKELSNLKKLEAAGFSHGQAEVLAGIIEESHIDGQQSLKEFLVNEFKAMDGKFETLEFKLKSSQSEMKADIIMKMSAIVGGMITAAVAIAKMLW